MMMKKIDILVNISLPHFEEIFWEAVLLLQSDYIVVYKL